MLEAVLVFIAQHIDRLETLHCVEFLTQDDVGLGLVGEDEPVSGEFTAVCQHAQDRDKRRDARTTGDEGALALVFDGAPGIADDEGIALCQPTDLLGQAIVTGIDLDGELQIVPGGQRGESEGVACIAPTILVDPDFGRLTGFKGKPVGFLESELADIVGDVDDAGNGKLVGHENALPDEV